nr:MAG TPA: Host-nuclease inhibitor protein [Caudoviricetes sp.]
MRHMSEMAPMSTLTERIGALAQLKELKNEIAENLKSCNAQIEQAEKEIIASMLDLADAAGLDDPSGFTVDVAGRRYGIKVKPFYSIRKDQRDEAFAALRTLGLGDLIVEKVDDRTLTKALEEAADAEGCLPPEYSILPVSAYEKTTITDRKVAK